MTPKVEVYTKGYCPFCKQTKETLRQLGLAFKELDIGRNKTLTKEMMDRSQRKTVPQIFINDVHVGGNDDFQYALRNGLWTASKSTFLKRIMLNVF